MIFYKHQLCDVCGHEVPVDIIEEITAFAEIGERFDLVTTRLTRDGRSADGTVVHHPK